MPRGAAAFAYFCLGAGDAVAGTCQSVADALTAAGCAADGSDCVLRTTTTSSGSGEVKDDNWALLATPARLAAAGSLPRANVTASVAGAFLTNLGIDPSGWYKAVRSGQPHDLIVKEIKALEPGKRERTVMWPHRLNADKQPEIMRDLAKHLKVIITQEQNWSKSEYYQQLAKTSVVFSCSLHENLGISQMEGVLAGAIPVVPDRASYTEMYPDIFKYPTEWTSSTDNYYKHKDRVIGLIADRMENYNYYADALKECENNLISNYLNANIMIGKLIGKNSG